MSASFSLTAFLAAEPSVALVRVVSANGSTPRDQGAWMLVSPTRIFETIGGGQLEYMAIDEARKLLMVLPDPLWGGSISEADRGGSVAWSKPPPLLAVSASLQRVADQPGGATDLARPSDPHEGAGKTLSIALGPEIGQCCGGRVELSVTAMTETDRADLLGSVRAQDERRPTVMLFGGGHVGLALAQAFALLPVRTVVVETRVDALDGLPQAVEARLIPVPEDAVRTAPSGTAFVVLTHDHALDFLIVAEALKRDDAAYVGMIGSRTKRGTFRSWFLRNTEGTNADLARLVCPIGGDAVQDKRPAVIAALAAAEIIGALATASAGKPASVFGKHDAADSK